MPTSKLKLLDDPTLSDADWSTNPPLSAEVFISTVTYDAHNRPLTSTDPGGNVQTYTYDRGGVLKSITLNSSTYVQDLHYDAKGQRSAIWYGNGTKTSYTYDPFNFRLRRLLTVKLSTNEILQDLHYWYDPVGNITEIQDDAQQTLFFNNSVVTPTQEFTYDALYRLMEAKGRELIGTASFGAEDNWNDAAWQTTHKGDGNALQNYTQLYTYDEVGNILQLRHVAGIGSYTRDYTIDSGSNRMEETEVGVNTYAYTYDTRGNMSEMPHLDEVKWNATNELCFIRRGSSHTHYQYSGGQRVRKFTDKGIIKEERIYLGSFEIYRKFENSSLKIERQTVHLSDNSGRIAMLEKRTFGVDPSPASLVRYIYSNHLQSASLELDENAAIISYEEYHPYGTTSYQAMNAAINAVAKRYRYTGKERDEESGLYYHGARYYVPWLGRWTAVDALESKYAGRTPYCYAANNPANYNDPTGNEEYKDEKSYRFSKGKDAKMDGSDGAWLESDRTEKNARWSKAMETITKDGMQDKLVGIHYNLLSNNSNLPRVNTYNFDIVRDYYHWVQKQVDVKGYTTQWAKGAAYLVDELAIAYQEGNKLGAEFGPGVGKLFNELNQGIANFAVTQFQEILFLNILPENTIQGWYKWDVEFVRKEQVTKVAPKVYKDYEGTKALDVMNDMARKEGFFGNMASATSTHFIPSFATFRFSINKREDKNSFSNNFGALGRMHIPLLMLYPDMHKDKVINVSDKGWKEIKRANKAIEIYYKEKMQY